MGKYLACGGVKILLQPAKSTAGQIGVLKQSAGKSGLAGPLRDYTWDPRCYKMIGVMI